MTQPEPRHTTAAVRSAESLGRMHFIGIGGVGMSAVARIMVARGLPVSGSDAKDLPVMADLAAAGARICVGYDAANLGDAQSVVAGSAIRNDNPELAAARAAGLPVLHRSEALAAAMAQDTAVTVAGTHGKSTTTSMIAVLLQGAGLDPSFAIGANVPALGVNAASGSSPVFVAEADESDGSFLNYRPQIAVVTNVEPDHLDYYGTAEAVYASFDRFTALLPADGVLVACADDPGARALALRTLERGNTRVVLYGTSDDAQIVLHDGGPGDVSITTAAGRFPLDRVALVRPAFTTEPLPPNLAIFPVLGRLLEEHRPRRALAELHRSGAWRAIAHESLAHAHGLEAQLTQPLAAERRIRLLEIPRDVAYRPGELRIAAPTVVLASPRDPVHPLHVAEAWRDELGCRMLISPARDDGEAAMFAWFRERLGSFLVGIR